MEENTNEKIAAFRDSVRHGINNELSGVIEDAQKESDAMIAAADERLLQYSFDYINRNTKDIKTENARRVAAFNAESKRMVLMRRNALIEEFFAEIEKKLIAFTEDREKYTAYVKELLDEAAAQKPFYNWARLLTRERDRDVFEPMLKTCEGLHLEVSSEIRIGGFILFYPKEKQYLDKTLDKALENQRGMFAYNKELHLS